MNITVLFNSVEEFSSELTQAKKENIFEQTVRTTGCNRSTSVSPIEHVFLLASFIEQSEGGNKLVKLERFCGQSISRKDCPAIDLYVKLEKQLAELTIKLGLISRPGVYEFPEKGAAK